MTNDAAAGDRREPSNDSRGYFIAFEGPEGAGKSTQLALLSKRLELAGIDAVLTREPGGTPAGDQIRGVILDPELEVAPITEFLLYSASRAQLVAEVIRPALERQRTVVSDRFAGASLAYQGYGRGLDLAFIRSLTQRVTGGVAPHLTLLFDLDVDTGLARVGERGARDRLELADVPFHRRVRSGFLELARMESSWHVLDASVQVEALAEQVWRIVSAHHPTLASHHREDATGNPEPAPPAEPTEPSPALPHRGEDR